MGVSSGDIDKLKPQYHYMKTKYGETHLKYFKSEYDDPTRMILFFILLSYNAQILYTQKTLSLNCLRPLRYISIIRQPNST